MGANSIQVTASVQPVSNSSSNGENGDHQKPKRDVKGAFKTIFIGVALPCLIILTVIAVLLSIIFTHRVNTWPGYPELTPTPTTTTHAKNLTEAFKYVKYTAGPAYLVKANPSTLTTIAQLTGKVIPYLTSSIMALVAFFAARYIVLESKKAEDASLPTPEHLTLLINLLSGNNFDPLIGTASFWWQTKRRLPAPIPAVFWSLCTITCMGLLIPVVDTWFGAATRAIPHVLLSESTSIHAYGRQLDRSSNSSCAGGPSNSLADDTLFVQSPSSWPCSVEINNSTADVSDPGFLSLTKSIDAIKLQYGANTSTLLSAFTHNSKQYYFYTDPQANGSSDFSASSPAISTQCLPMTSTCLDSSSDGEFSCSSGFSGYLPAPFPLTLYTHRDPTLLGLAVDVDHLGIGFSTTADLLDPPTLVNAQDNITGQTTYPSFLAQNPQYFGTWAMGYPDKVALAFSDLRNDPQVIQIADGSVVWFLNCTTVVANATYTFVNGSIATFNPIQIDDVAMANLFTAPFNLFHLNQVIGTLFTDLGLRAALTSNSTELANTWAAEFSKMALSLANGVFVPLTNVLQQDRTNTIVAQLPKIPLFILIVLKLVYVVALIALAIGAYAFTHPAETEVVKQQLSTKGLAAAYFDSPGLLQANAVKAFQELASPTPNEKPNPMDGKTATTQVDEVLPGSPTATSPADLNNGAGPQVGLVANAQGAWTFAVRADGVWHTIQPVVNLFIDAEVKEGKLDQTTGDILKSL